MHLTFFSNNWLLLISHIRTNVLAIPPKNSVEQNKQGAKEASEAAGSREAASGIRSHVGKEQMASSHHREAHPTETGGVGRLSSPLTTLAEGRHNKQQRVNDGHHAGLISQT